MPARFAPPKNGCELTGTKSAQLVWQREPERKTARKYGVGPGMRVIDITPARRRRDEGFQFIAVASKAGVILAKARETATALGLGTG